MILYKHGLKDEIDPHKLEVLESTIDENTGGTISYQEFVNIVSLNLACNHEKKIPNV